jgi:hypothetical protein
MRRSEFIWTEQQIRVSPDIFGVEQPYDRQSPHCHL